jgi:predicted DNA-binding transcriptional regulator AlpA
MGRKIDVTDLVGAAEIAERLGLAHPQTVHTWRRRHADFPAPVAVLKQAMVWSWPDVQEWVAQRGQDKVTRA